ncbi:E3 ubiquitin-protein ligase EL5-like [Triticum urartu]|uniref:E3 ubiquitin-protein ligase EL5-like n=1 Tax=Triticum urartu TaxID=4572 RepID=UPI002043EB9C|nr:E3 ubiquitin-protein ligase EL5-like [Triticum urartu]
MAVTATTAAAAATMLAAVMAIFLSFVLCFYIFLCAKRSRGGAPPPPGSGVMAHLRFLFCGGDGRAGAGDGVAPWFYDGGLDDASMASLPRREVAKGEAMDCAVCITELAAGETARVLPRCGHGFHVDCVDMWLKSHSTCPLCRCPAVDAPPLPPAPVQAPEADQESPNFPTNVLFFGSQDDVSTGRAQPQQPSPTTTTPQSAPTPSQAQAPAAGACGLRRLLGCGGASSPPQAPQEEDAARDIEMGLAGVGESSASSRQTKPPQPAGSC